MLLALVALHPGVSGYQLRSIIRRVTSFFFTISLSQIYPTLQQLADEGLVTFEVAELVGKQDRKMYTITPAGLEYLHARLREPLQPGYSMTAFRDLLLRLNFMAHLDDAEIRAYLEQVLAQLRADRLRMQQETTRLAIDYLGLGGRAQRRYVALYAHENRFLLADFDAKIAWVEDLIENLDEILGS